MTTLNITYFKRIIALTVGLFIMSVGVALSIKADIGVSPISCVPYIYSLRFPLSIGELMILINVLFMLMQMAILRRNYNLIQLVQLPAIIFFGYCIDTAMVLVVNIEPTSYIVQFILCLVSCVVLAFGIFLVVKSKLTYLPVEGLVVVIAQTFKKEFGKVKISMDSMMVITGIVSSFFFLGELVGIREGSIIAALSIGVLIKFISLKLPMIEKWLTDESSQKPNVEDLSIKYNNTFVLTISREFGSGGHEIGKYIAKELGIAFYDKDLIDLTAQKTGYTKEYIEENEQKLTNSLLYELYEQNFNYVNDEIPPKDALFLIQSKIIRDICAKESAVIVGRCANFILKDHPNCINIFVHANMDYREKRINTQYNLNTTFTKDDLKTIDIKRANYCYHFTKKEWNDKENYHLYIDSSQYGSSKSGQKVLEFIKINQEKKL
ncbi:hypothetical protein ALC152_08800 [Arcobacter sp. 15-2]|uniref:DUF6198 family protein n=1 Tax=Arcobacter sp. 15-2 TaxID=3374109 RepID=UPI00399CB659